MSTEKNGVTKEPRAWNRYTGKRAQNLEWVRNYLHSALAAKQARGHILNREMLTACKMLLVIEGVKLDRVGTEKNGGRKPKGTKSVINLPKFLETWQ